MKKNKQGRPKGSCSTVSVRLKDLTKYYTPYSVIMVGKTWLENSGFKINENQMMKLIRDISLPDAVRSCLDRVGNIIKSV